MNKKLLNLLEISLIGTLAYGGYNLYNGFDKTQTIKPKTLQSYYVDNYKIPTKGYVELIDLENSKNLSLEKLSNEQLKAKGLIAYCIEPSENFGIDDSMLDAMPKKENKLEFDISNPWCDYRPGEIFLTKYKF